jgi:5-(carboxyamino)imidazole ribonucleotide synthase
VGILGGGQLARMLVQAAWGLGVRPLVMADNPRSPAAKVAPGTVIGDFDNEQALRELLSRADKIVFENEFVRKDLLERAAGGRSPFWPRLEVIGQLQDKASQKEVLTRLGIPAAPYECVRTADNLESWIAHMHETFPAGAAFKWTHRGYDGKGVYVSSGKPEELPAAADFCRQALERGIAVLAEQKVDFKRELAIVACYSKNREFAAYPLVISEQWQGICSRVWGPARAFGATEAQENQAREYARKLAEALQLTGVFALELFELPSGEIWVNEIAPRVHNSGHYTQDAAATSQFENHWRAVLGMPLGKTTTSAGFAMLNLLGPEGVTMRSAEAPILAPPRGLHLHWYEKDEIQPRRKLGHVNARTDDPARVPMLLEQMENYRKHWADALTRPLSEEEEFRRRPDADQPSTTIVERDPEDRHDPDDEEIQLTGDYESSDEPEE